MKKLKKTWVTLLISLLVFSTIILKAQIKPIEIAEKCPDELIEFLLKHRTSNRDQSRHKRPIILDFWATYCAPCVKKIPLLDSLQNEYSDFIDIIGITEQKESSLINEVLSKILKKRNMDFIMADSIARQYFPHSTLPHYVWINADGVVSAITSTIDKISITAFIQSNKVNLSNKPKKLIYSAGKSFFLDEQPSKLKQIAFQSTIAKYRPDLPTLDARGDRYITVSNNSILHLYQIAFGKFDMDFLDLNRIEVQGLSDKLDSARIGIWTGDNFNMWKKNIEENAYTYELSVNEPSSVNELFSYMQYDLNRYFARQEIVGSIEMRDKEVYSLISLEGHDHLQYQNSGSVQSNYATKNDLQVTNAPINLFLAKLRGVIGYLDHPIINATGYTGVVSINLAGNLKQLQSVNQSLSKYGLKLQKGMQRLPIIVLKKGK